ncbi:unnamed protein product [Spirodela intermedia]|uniref:RING-type E3 ubiquitin transferase n=1 Tax=Spirodela intermedia TaxID=51605 RepID=A0A7I8IIM7_SPIIN|nr:unnamed protein product [Spirodela intermedia]CAA6657732.1 unnamed protein product [Spirodela intermedia]
MAAPAAPPGNEYGWGPSQSSVAWPPANRKAEDLVSPPLIAMVAVVGTAFLVVFYVRLLSRHLGRCRRRWRQWRRRRRLGLSTDLESNGGGGGGGGFGFDYYSSGASSNYFLSPYGLDDSAIKTLPLSFFSAKAARHLFYRECAVCLVEFEENDSLRTLPLCAHAFHVDCIDVWLRSHANCPLCRAAVFRQDSSSPFVPMRAARIRPSFDDFLLDPPLPPPPPPPPPPESDYSLSEIAPDTRLPGDDAPVRRPEQRRRSELPPETILLLRIRAEPGGGAHDSGRLHRVTAVEIPPPRVLEQAVAVPFWWRRRWLLLLPDGQGVLLPVLPRRDGRQVPLLPAAGVLPLSESGVRFAGAAGPSSRRTRSLTSPVGIFSRPPCAAGWSASSRLRCGDPEALLPRTAWPRTTTAGSPSPPPEIVGRGSLWRAARQKLNGSPDCTLLVLNEGGQAGFCRPFSLSLSIPLPHHLFFFFFFFFVVVVVLGSSQGRPAVQCPA